MHRWYHHDISGQEAEKLLLLNGVNGSFLVRRSDRDKKDYCISVLCGKTVTHVKIQNRGDHLLLGKKFPNLADCIDYYCIPNNFLKESNGETIALLHSIDNNEPEPLERWFHGRITPMEAEKLLFEKGKDGSYLVRESINMPNSYVISVLLGSRIAHVRIVRENSKYNVGGGQEFSQLYQLISFYSSIPMIEKNGSLIHLKQPVNTTRIHLPNLGGRIKLLQVIDNRTKKNGFSEEFESLQNGVFDDNDKDNCCNQGQLEVNELKNRYKTILPYDKNRVILHDFDVNVPGSDYINASFITTPKFSDLDICSSQRYIATQGLLNETIVDFWRMAWQENVKVIVLVTNFVENKRLKCVPYWPNNNSQPPRELDLPHGDKMFVSLVTEISFDVYIKRTISISRISASSLKSQTKEQQEAEILKNSRTINHFHFIGWTDRQTPEDPSSLLDFMCQVNNVQSSSTNNGGSKSVNENDNINPPIIVQCSHGIGRTGAYIVVDMLLNHVRTRGVGSEVDICRTVQALREQRAGMVQTVQQYNFIYNCIYQATDTTMQRYRLTQKMQLTGHDYTNLQLEEPLYSNHSTKTSLPLPAVQLQQNNKNSPDQNNFSRPSQPPLPPKKS